jgi:nicotinamide-nucleotide amidase
MLNETTLETAATLLGEMQARKLTLATAESCTGGLIAAALTAIPGSSATLLAGYVTYSNAAKRETLGVAAETLRQHGAVSRLTAIEMVQGALRIAQSDLAVACTGIAGPDGGSEAKPVGLVFIGCGRKGQPVSAHGFVFPGDRAAVRAATVDAAFALLRAELLEI